MLGTVAETEDILQDAFLRWQRARDGRVQSVRSYLAAVVTRLCLDHLQSARARRESYVGPWLPEPLLTRETEPDAAERAETLSTAFLVLLQSLNPVERAVFLLREVFDYDYAEVARIVDKSEANCRQIARRAREFLSTRRPRFEPSPAQREELSRRFAAACERGDLPGLVSLLSDEITVWSDHGGKATAALNPIHGARNVARYLLGVRQKFHSEDPIYPVELNGRPGFLTFRNGRVNTAVSLEMADGRITGIYVMRNPEKLARLQHFAE